MPAIYEKMQFIFLLLSQVKPPIAEAFFSQHACSFKGVDWERPIKELVSHVENVTSVLPVLQQSRLYTSLSRIYRMNEGDAKSVLENGVRLHCQKLYQHFASLSSSLERSCWLYTAHRALFDQMELGSHHQLAKPPYWGRYRLKKSDQLPNMDHQMLDLFDQTLCKLIGDITKTISSRHDDAQAKGFHLSIYHSQLPEKNPLIKGNELQFSTNDSAIRYQLAYNHELGTLEVCANDESLRSALAHTFTATFLNQQHIVHQQYSLTKIFDIPQYGCSSNSRISTIKLVNIKAQDAQWNGCVEISFPLICQNMVDIRQYAQSYFSASNPLSSKMFTVTQATILIELRGQQSGNNNLLVSIQLPNLCDLQNLSFEHQAIVRECLTQWGVML